MEFGTLFKRTSPRIRMLAERYRSSGPFFDREDLYQEMCAYLWDKFKEGVPEGLNDAYIVKGCEFYMMNYVRKERDKATTLSLEEPCGEEGDTLKDFVADRGKPLHESLDAVFMVASINENGFSVREKEVLPLLLEGHRVREIGRMLGVSHVMVVKLKKRIISKWRKKAKIKVTKEGEFLLL